MSDVVDAAAPVAPVWPRTIKLATPVVFGDQTITELVFQKGKLGIIKGLRLSSEVPVDDLVTIASRLSAQPTQVIALLDVDDGQEAMSIALDFYVKCLSGIAR